MMTENVMLQNAIRINNTGEVLISRHRHDFVVSSCDKFYLDGGTDYQRIGGKQSEYTELTIYINDPLEKRVEHALWGTYGKEGNGPLTWVFLKDCETSHLEAILNTHVALATWIQEVIKEILRNRNES